MVGKRAKRRTARKALKKKSRFTKFIKKEGREFYLHCVHPLSCRFMFWTENWHNILYISVTIGFLLSLFSQMYPICTQDICYRTFIQFLSNPDLLTKPFAALIVLPQFAFLFAVFSWMWFGIFHVLKWVQQKKSIPEILPPLLAIALFVYMLLVTSGMLTPFVVTTGNFDCVTNDDCLRAGYVGEVCTSVYKPVYTTYSPDLKPLTKCSCIENKCVGS